MDAIFVWLYAYLDDSEERNRFKKLSKLKADTAAFCFLI